MKKSKTPKKKSKKEDEDDGVLEPAADIDALDDEDIENPCHSCQGEGCGKCGYSGIEAEVDPETARELKEIEDFEKQFN